MYLAAQEQDTGYTKMDFLANTKYFQFADTRSELLLLAHIKIIVASDISNFTSSCSNRSNSTTKI